MISQTKTGLIEQQKSFNPFHEICLILYLLKTSANQKFPDVFRWYRKSSDMKWVNDIKLKFAQDIWLCADRIKFTERDVKPFFQLIFQSSQCHQMKILNERVLEWPYLMLQQQRFLFEKQGKFRKISPFHLGISKSGEKISNF